MGRQSIFEKKICNTRLFATPREVKIHRLAEASQSVSSPFTARLLRHRTGPLRTILEIEFLNGRPARRLRDLGDIGAFIAGVEAQTKRHLFSNGGVTDGELDFYKSGASVGRRYNIRAIASSYRKNHPEPFAGFDTLMEHCAVTLDVEDQELAEAGQVVCHLDHLLQNFMYIDEKLYLIDWGEGYIGRPGFDAGCFMMVMMRAYDIPVFRREASAFLKSYSRHASAVSSEDPVPGMRRIFLPRMLSYLLRIDAVKRFEERQGLDAWREKIRHLGDFISKQTWIDLSTQE
jgi:hypothetical protein